VKSASPARISGRELAVLFSKSLLAYLTAGGLTYALIAKAPSPEFAQGLIYGSVLGGVLGGSWVIGLFLSANKPVEVRVRATVSLAPVRLVAMIFVLILVTRRFGQGTLTATLVLTTIAYEVFSQVLLIDASLSMDRLRQRATDASEGKAAP
jgi:hypothetical protein